MASGEPGGGPVTHVVLATVGSAGDVVPLVGLGAELRARGHRVSVLTNPYFRGVVERADLELVPTGPSRTSSAPCATLTCGTPPGRCGPSRGRRSSRRCGPCTSTSRGSTRRAPCSSRPGSPSAPASRRNGSASAWPPCTCSPPCS
ncbi:glycosyltransferase family 1 protein [Georgenia yuyongxinii]|uniref:Glycosyltransferase family 1 protein n=1 Tax=Georgenia yuyongxinii TaxID=2589797 RepID=A0A552WTA9_9MICO|nr:glycosyltransferase family 1 protein [Georgenia yuyongxinii]